MTRNSNSPTSRKFQTSIHRRPYKGLEFDEKTNPSLTKQSFAEECDINNIMKRFQETGIAPVLREAGRYGDFTSVTDFQQSMDIVIAAQETFDALPAHVRDRFGNDPAQFLAFAEKPENLPEMVKLGLAEEIKPAAPQKVEVVNPEPVKAPKNASEASE